MTAPRALLGTLLLTALAGSALAGGYFAGGTFVVKDSSTGVTVVDNGGAICQGLSGGGIGGGCLPLPSPLEQAGFVEVNDNSAGHNVAFQVCIDNNGDGICGGQITDERCRDQIFFSHADGGAFFNPLGPLPARTLDGCPKAFQGYIVLLCQGEHNDPKTGAHTHSLTAGTIQSATFGTGYGNFCGGGFGGSPAAGGFVNAAAKAYKVI